MECRDKPLSFILKTMKKELDIKEVKQIQIEILQVVHTFCSENNIYYSLTYGTLIGSIRHKGYIPWDDDIDICMPRPDYNRFIKLFNTQKTRYKITSFELEPSFPYQYAKVSDMDTLLIEYSDLKYELGINIDVFPIDGIKLNSKTLAKQIFYHKMLDFKIVRVSSDRSFFRNSILSLGKFILNIIPKKLIVKKMVENAQVYSFEETELVTCISFGSKLNLPVSKSLFEDRVLSEFEGGMFYIMSGYDKYLKSIYGDYMQLPPLAKRVSTHKFQAYITTKSWVIKTWSITLYSIVNFL